MKNSEREKIREPFDPRETPAPPQIVDPNVSDERNENRAPIEAKKSKQTPDNSKEEPAEKLLGESPTEIDDETTI